jgi:hypothetical protein
MKRVAILILLALEIVCCSAHMGYDKTTEDMTLISNFEGGRLYKIDNIYVAQLSGSYREMGKTGGISPQRSAPRFFQSKRSAMCHKGSWRFKIGAGGAVSKGFSALPQEISRHSAGTLRDLGHESVRCPDFKLGSCFCRLLRHSRMG